MCSWPSGVRSPREGDRVWVLYSEEKEKKKKSKTGKGLLTFKIAAYAVGGAGGAKSLFPSWGLWTDWPPGLLPPNSHLVPRAHLQLLTRTRGWKARVRVFSTRRIVLSRTPAVKTETCSFSVHLSPEWGSIVETALVTALLEGGPASCLRHLCEVILLPRPGSFAPFQSLVHFLSISLEILKFSKPYCWLA